ncbi:MAG: NADH dehydrogenase, subunit 5 [uncultured Thiotrichaceae bacterium]|uniref:Probable inorganic carbon transporter subunit DabB n=1 Tax=uncultured Thiotrichaceae bacterium TaxID=298394 RepID=A0A6S6SUV4_9GAMM|nr:MAG: NADH dehydrogenase, subunit 5 [uncultured Thiotrichaceae bacterium]
MSITIIQSMILLSIPALFFVTSWTNEKRAHWNLAMSISLLALLISFVIGIQGILGIHKIGEGVTWATHSPISLVMLCLISFIAFINIRYSRSYMSGNPEDERRYLRWLLITLSTVTLVVVSNHMLVFMAAWIAISTSLHQLLNFYPERQRAALAAYKKYIFAHIAEAFLLVGIICLYLEHETWLISDVVRQLSTQSELTVYGQIAAITISVAALIKCAQLPLHGWLIQVVEAPTPVSALLHAGIINLGGYLLIIFAPLIMLSAPAQALLLFVGGITTVLAALVMMTRASVKVRLAWSTMSQMGLMLVECALGLFELALLHLIAHSCYKAYAFLNSGSEVETRMKKRFAKRAPPSLLDFLVAALLAAVMVTIMAILFKMTTSAFVEHAAHDVIYSPWVLLGIALMLLIAERKSRTGRATFMTMFSFALVVLVAYTLQKIGASFILPQMHNQVGLAGDLWMVMLFIFFLFGYIALRYYKHHPRVVPIWRSFYAGFYLDESITRLSMRLHPTKLPERHKPKQLKIAKGEML